MTPKIDISTTTAINCRACGHFYFREDLLLRKVSRFIINSKADAVMPIPVMVCTSCASVCEEALSPEVQELLFPKPDIKIALA